MNEQGENVKLDYNLLEELFTKPKIMLNGNEEKKDESKMENKSSFKKLPSLNDAPMPVDNSVYWQLRNFFILFNLILTHLLNFFKKGNFLRSQKEHEY